MTIVSFLNYGGAIIITSMLMIPNSLHLSVIGLLVRYANLLKLTFNPINFSIPRDRKRFFLAARANLNSVSNSATRGQYLSIFCELFVLGALDCA